MNTYMLLFVNNKTDSGNRGNAEMEEPYRYEHSNGRLVYAITKANDKDNARTIARFIIGEIGRGTAIHRLFIISRRTR